MGKGIENKKQLVNDCLVRDRVSQEQMPSRCRLTKSRVRSCA